MTTRTMRMRMATRTMRMTGRMIMAVTVPLPLAGRFDMSLHKLTEATLWFGSNRRCGLATINLIVFVTMPVIVAVARMAVTVVMVLRVRDP